MSLISIYVQSTNEEQYIEYEYDYTDVEVRKWSINLIIIWYN